MWGYPHFWNPPYCHKSSSCFDFVLRATVSTPGKVQPEVKSAIGYSQADSYNNVTYATQSYLNRPLTCAVDSAGDLIFADFNHRLRTVMERFCRFGRFSSADVEKMVCDC